MSEEPELIVRTEGAVGRLTLNRPRALHALTLGMCEAMTDALLAWKDDPAVKLVILDHSGERGFCAGGDIKVLAQSGADDGAAARQFFAVEYRLNHLLHAYLKPVVAVMDGIVMGGGVGIAIPASHRLATERTVVAMPETGIGLFPDVGGGWFLPRLPGKVGLWMALTGERVRAADCVALGIATHYAPSAEIEAIKAELVADPAALDVILARHAADPGPAPIEAIRPTLDRLFGAGDPLAIAKALEADGGDWASAQLKNLKSKSPQTMMVAHRQLEAGAKMATFADNMRLEYRIGARMVRLHDFIEGVRAVLVDKTGDARWDPPSLEAVQPATLDAIFAALPADEEWQPLPGVTG